MRVVFAFSVKNKGIKVEHPQQEAKKEKTGRLERVRRFIKKLKGSNKDLNTPNPFDNKSNRDKDVDNLAVFRNESVRDKVIECLKEFKENKMTARELVGKLNTLVSPSENALEQNAFHNFLERQLSPEQYKEVKKLGVIALYRPLPRTLTTEDLSGMSTSTASRKSRTRNLFNRDTPKRKAKNRGQQNSRG